MKVYSVTKHKTQYIHVKYITNKPKR